MGFFSFLSPEQDEAPPDIQKPVRVPKGAKVRQPGKDYSLADEEWAGEQDDIIPADNIPKASPEEMDPAGVRRKFSADESGVVQKEQAAVRKVKDILTKQTHSLGGDYGNAQLHQVLDAINKGMLDPGQLTDDVQTILKSKSILPQTAQALASAANDLKLAQAARQQLEAGRSAVPAAEAVSPDVYAGHSQEAFQKAKELRESVRGKGILSQGEATRQAQNLEAQGKSLQELGQQGKEASAQPEAPVGSDPVTNFMKGIGVDREQLVPRLHTALDKVGIPKEQWEDQNVDPSAGMMRVLSELDPKGQFAQLMVQQLATARAEDAAAKQNISAAGGAAAGAKGQDNQQIDQTQQAIEGKEARMRQLYGELRQAPFMQTWPGMILYVLVGIVTQNPAFAARLIGGVGNRAAVDAEMKGIHYDLKRLDDKLHYERQSEIYQKREAARRMNKKEDEVDQRKWELSKLMLQHQLIIKRNAARGNPETFLLKKLSSDFQRNLGMASKFQGTMQNEFADPKERAVAKQNFDVYMRRAAELDADIRKLGVTAAGEDQVGADGE